MELDRIDDPAVNYECNTIDIPLHSYLRLPYWIMHLVFTFMHDETLNVLVVQSNGVSFDWESEGLNRVRVYNEIRVHIEFVRRHMAQVYHSIPRHAFVQTYRWLSTQVFDTDKPLFPTVQGSFTQEFYPEKTLATRCLLQNEVTMCTFVDPRLEDYVLENPIMRKHLFPYDELHLDFGLTRMHACFNRHIKLIDHISASHPMYQSFGGYYGDDDWDYAKLESDLNMLRNNFGEYDCPLIENVVLKIYDVTFEYDFSMSSTEAVEILFTMKLKNMHPHLKLALSKHEDTMWYFMSIIGNLIVRAANFREDVVIPPNTTFVRYTDYSINDASPSWTNTETPNVGTGDFNSLPTLMLGQDAHTLFHPPEPTTDDDDDIIHHPPHGVIMWDGNLHHNMMILREPPVVIPIAMGDDNINAVLNAGREAAQNNEEEVIRRLNIEGPIVQEPVDEILGMLDRMDHN